MCSGAYDPKKPQTVRLAIHSALMIFCCPMRRDATSVAWDFGAGILQLIGIAARISYIPFHSMDLLRYRLHLSHPALKFYYWIRFQSTREFIKEPGLAHSL